MRLVAALACVVVASRITIQQSLTAGIILSILLLPVWIGALWRVRGGSSVLLFGSLAVVSGVTLTEFFSADHATSTSMMQQNSFALISLVGGIGVLVWARTLLGLWSMALWYGLGLLGGLAVHGLDFDNIWKFSLSIPVTIIALAVCRFTDRRSVEVVMLAALAVVSALNDSRSAGSMLLLAAALVVWQALGATLRQRSSTVRTLAVFGFVGVVGYSALQAFILEGWFGKAAAVRSQEQISQSGSLILGGRPEIGASTELIASNPFGLGSGTLANGVDLITAKTGMARLNYDPNNGYVERYMFGNGFEVHSMLGDLWIRFGILGALLLVTLLVMVALGAAHQVARRQASGLMIFLTIQVFWDALFAPFFSTSAATLMLAVALAATPRVTSHARKRAQSSEFVSFHRA